MNDGYNSVEFSFFIQGRLLNTAIYDFAGCINCSICICINETFYTAVRVSYNRYHGDILADTSVRNDCARKQKINIVRFRINWDLIPACMTRY